MPTDPSYLANEPSYGPVVAQVTTKPSTLTPAETAANAVFKTIAVDPIVQQLSATTVSMSVFTCDDNYQVASVTAVAETLGGAGATVTVERLTGATAPGSGVAQLTAALNVGSTGTAHAVQTGTLKTSPDTFGKGDRLGIVMAGTLTGLVGHITVTLKRV